VSLFFVVSVVVKSVFHHKTDSGLKPRPSGRREGGNPGLKAGVSTVATWEGREPLPGSFTAAGMNACRQ
jgi:hypothetical protein